MLQLKCLLTLYSCLSLCNSPTAPQLLSLLLPQRSSDSGCTDICKTLPSAPTQVLQKSLFQQGLKYHLLFDIFPANRRRDGKCMVNQGWCTSSHSSRSVPSFPGGSVVKSSPARAGDARDAGLIPGLERSPGGGNGNPLQCSCLENPMDRGACWATVHGVTKIQT